MSRWKKKVWQQVETSFLEKLALLEGEHNGVKRVNEVIQIYLVSTPELIKGIFEGLKQKDTDHVKGKAHALKSASANIGAHKLSAHCLEIEIAAKKNDWSGVQKIFTALGKSYQTLISELNEILHG